MNKKINTLLIVLSIASIVGVFIKLGDLPDKIPVHWNFAGEVDSWGSKYTYLLLSALPFLMTILANVLPKVDPKKENYKYQKKTYEITMTLLICLFIVLPWGVLLFLNHQSIDATTVVVLPIAILMIILGYFMPTFKQTFFVGIRTPWTLADEEVWNKTHSVGGYVFIGIGVIMLLTLFVRVKFMSSLLIVGIIGGVVGLYIYSYLIYKKKH